MLLDDCVSYGSRCLPDAPSDFHRGWAYWVLGTALGSYVKMNFATPVYPCINPLFIGRSGSWKSQSLNLAKDIIRRVMPDLELGETFTESGMTEELNNRRAKFDIPEGYLIVDEFGHLIETMGADWNKGASDYVIKLLDGECKGRLIKTEKSQLLTFSVRVSMIAATTPSRASTVLEKRDVLDGLVPRFWPIVYLGKLTDSIPPGITSSEEKMRDAIVDDLKKIRSTVVSCPVHFTYSPSSHCLWLETTKKLRRSVKKLITHDANVNQAKVHFHRISMLEEVSSGNYLAQSPVVVSDLSAETARAQVMKYASNAGLLYRRMGSNKDMQEMLDAIEQTMPTGVSIRILRRVLGMDGKRFEHARKGLLYCERIVEEKKVYKTKPFTMLKLAKIVER